MYIANGLCRQDATRRCDFSVIDVNTGKQIRVPTNGSAVGTIPEMDFLAGRKANIGMSAKRLKEPSRTAFLCANTQEIQQSKLARFKIVVGTIIRVARCSSSISTTTYPSSI